MKNVLLILFAVIFLTSCGNAGNPDPINFGSDLCVHCNMKIMDKRFGAEIVSGKGKTFKFDAAECMIEYLTGNSIQGASYWVIDYKNPESFVNAKNASFLISMNIKSPMGEFLSCYKSRNDAEASKNTSGGEIYSWDEIRQKIKSR